MVRELAVYERLEDRLTGDAQKLHELLAGSPPALHALIAERDGAPIGYVIGFRVYSTFRTQPILWLEDLYVSPAERGGGVGKALLQAAARLAVDMGCLRMSWEVLEWNEPAIGFYERMGATRDEGGWFIYHLREGLDRLAQGELPQG
jgi:GNAT superfamily N-acetyltransferase